MTTLDSDGSGRISKAELRQSKEQMNWSPRQTNIIEQIEANYHTMSRAVMRSGLKTSFSNSFTTEISARDVVRFNEMHGELKQELKDVTNALEFGKRNFKTMDKDNNGYLSLAELTNSRALSPKEIGQLIKKLPQIQAASNDELDFESKGASKQDLSKYPTNWKREEINIKDSRSITNLSYYRQHRLPTLISKGSVLEVAK
ncbi:MAG: hypothetical protein K2W95_13750 [Candidatus Obscuribacterales bacterium]|nr:hypothetical protein [Candidatus Obscuribacterales bacterium]